MKIKKSIQAFLAVVVLVLGAGEVSAQDSTPQAVGPRQDTIQTVLQAVADETGLDTSQILLQTVQGQTLSDIIAANGGDADTVINTIVTQLTADINQQVADGSLTQRRANRLLDRIQHMVTCAVNGELRGGRPIIRAEENLLQAASDATGMQPFDIQAQVRAGQAIAQIITAHGASVEAVISSAVNSATDNINQAVNDGCLNQDQADNMTANLQNLFTTMVNHSPASGIIQRQIGVGVIRLAGVMTSERPAQIRLQMRAGQTLAEILAAHSVDLNTFIGAAVAQVQNRLDQAVQLGRIQQSTEGQLLDTFRQRLTDLLNGVTPTPEVTVTGI